MARDRFPTARTRKSARGLPRTGTGTPRQRKNNWQKPKSAECAVIGVGFSWVQVPPGNWSLQPEAVGAAVEVTKLSKPSMSKGRLAT